MISDLIAKIILSLFGLYMIIVYIIEPIIQNIKINK